MKKIYKEALEKYHNNFIDDSKILFKKIVKSDPDHHQSINMLGLIANVENDIELSIKYIKKAVELNPQNGYYRNNLGVVYLKKDDYDGALEEFIKAITYKKDISEAYSNAGFILHKKGRLEEAKQMFEKALAYNPKNFQAYLNGANLCKDMGDFNQALGHYMNIINQDPKNLEAHLKTAELYFELQGYNEALEYYVKAIDINPAIADDSFLKTTINQIYTKLFPISRFPFYNDKEAADLYSKWIEKNMVKNKTFLEYTDAEGIISLKCALAGAKHATIVTLEPFLSSRIHDLIKSNKLQNSTKVIRKVASEVKLVEDVEEKVDCIIADIFQNKFPTYKEQLLVRSFKERFLKENGKIFPKSIKLFIAPIYSEELWKIGSASNFLDIDISVFHNYRSYYLYERLNGFRYEILSKPIEVYAFELGAIPLESWRKNCKFEFDTKKQCHGLVVWFAQNLDDELIIEANPLFNKNQNYFVHLFDKVMTIDSTLSFDIHYADFPIFNNIKS